MADQAGFPIIERSLVQSGAAGPLEAVGLTPQNHFQGCDTPSGRGARLSVRPGFDLSVYDLAVGHGAQARATTEPCVAIVVLIKGAGEGALLSQDGPANRAIPYSNGTIYISHARKPVQGEVTVHGSGFQLVELRMSRDFLTRMGLWDIFASADASHPLHHCDNDQAWLGIAQTPHAMLNDAKAIFRDAMRQGDRDLMVEARALRLLDGAAAMMRQGNVNLRLPDFTERDWKRLEQAHALLTGNMAHRWTIPRVAREIGLNEKKLKAGFKSRYGMPVHGYLQRARLEHARELLAAGNISVTEISLAVGYANPSHFARLFLRQFGIQPSFIGRRDPASA